MLDNLPNMMDEDDIIVSLVAVVLIIASIIFPLLLTVVLTTFLALVIFSEYVSTVGLYKRVIRDQNVEIKDAMLRLENER